MFHNMKKKVRVFESLITVLDEEKDGVRRPGLPEAIHFLIGTFQWDKHDVSFFSELLKMI